MENTITNNVILDKKVSDYRFEEHNFVAPQEITVTITISEYRDLVKKVATRQADIDKAEADRYERNTENNRLKQEVAELKAKLYELQNKGNVCQNHEEEKSDE